MKKFLVIFFAFSLSVLNAQIFENPVSWSWKSKKVSDTEYQLIFNANIEPGWHLYSAHVPPDVGPYPTAFLLDTIPNFTFVGGITEGEPHVEWDPNFEADLAFFSDKAEFVQTVKITSEKDFTIKGEIEWMVCNDERCLPPKLKDFTFNIKGVKAAAEAKEESGNTNAIIPNNDSGENTEAVESENDEPIVDEAISTESNIKGEPIERDLGPGMTFWAIFVAGFFGGLFALIMPCIFPMIPLTVSFFTKQSKTKAEGIRKATIYGISIIVIYVALGLLVSYFFGSDAMNQFATNPWVNVGFFVLFVVFAISFFGAFEITLPSSWVNKADDASNKGGLIGIFFMAFTLSLVSFSCTGPIIGLLLVEAGQSGNLLGPAIGMFGFSLALAIPFTLFAIFPGWLNSMPKSGGWLNTVKVSLGFLELAFAFKFLSTADLVWQTHFLEREMFLAIWVGIIFMLVLYLLGVFLMPLDSKVERIPVPRMLFALVFTILGFYILPGIWGAPVKIISGFPPPEFYAESPGGGSFGGGGDVIEVNPDAGDFDFGTNCPHGLNCFNDYEAGLEYAKSVNKPILLDFTGWGCVNCRKMEENVWVDPGTHKRLSEEFVLISLYVDAREKLPESEQHVSKDTGQKIKTIGHKWSEFQTVNFKANAQPFYVIVGHDDLIPLIETRAFNLDIDAYNTWLDSGLEAFKKK